MAGKAFGQSLRRRGRSARDVSAVLNAAYQFVAADVESLVTTRGESPNTLRDRNTDWWQEELHRSGQVENVHAEPHGCTNRRFAESDAICTDLATRGITLEDTPNGTRWWRQHK